MELYFVFLYFFIIIYLMIPYIAQTKVPYLGYAAIFLKNYQVSFEVKVKSVVLDKYRSNDPPLKNVQTPYHISLKFNKTRGQKYKMDGKQMGGGLPIYTFIQANCIKNT